MRRDELRRKFSQTVGVTKAESIVADAEAALGLEARETYSSDEVRDLCEEIQQAYDGYVSDVANEIRVHEQAQQRFQTLLENIPDPAVVVGFDAEEPVVKTVNAAFEATFGFDTADAVGRSLASLIAPEGEETPAHDAWLRDTNVTEQEVRRVTADGEIRTFLFRAALAQRAGGQVEGYGIYTDITARKDRERKLHHQNERLEQFASVVSHDLRNPLNVASGHLELARDHVDDEAAREELDAIAAAHEQMESLIEDLLTLAREGHTVGETEVVDLAERCENAWTHVQTDEASLDLDLNGMTVAADPSRLAELLGNLFRNALEHAGPTVTVRVGTDGEEGDGFYVEDDGPGVPAAEREAVFEYGYSTNSEGTGFGLAIVRSIAEAHGWTVELREGTGGGARFEFSGVRTR